jgi:hypothetical protein
VSVAFKAEGAAAEEARPAAEGGAEAPAKAEGATASAAAPKAPKAPKKAKESIAPPAKAGSTLGDLIKQKLGDKLGLGDGEKK